MERPVIKTTAYLTNEDLRDLAAALPKRHNWKIWH